MTKLRFLLSLQERLSGLPEEDVEERLHFYSEIIEDRMEEGLSEEEAVAAVGSVDEIAAQILADIPLIQIVRKNIQPKRRLKAWEIVLLALGAPIWLSLLLAAFSVILALYASLWSVIISLWAVFASLIACAVAGVVAGMGFALGGDGLSGLVVISTGLVCAGLSIFLFFGCKAVTSGTILLTRKLVFSLKNCFVKKEGA